MGKTFLYANFINPTNQSIMAKLVAPLGSYSASGKVGKALVYFTHLGRNVVRGLVTPANPQTTTQGDSRLLLGASGRSARAVVDPSDALTDLKTVTPAGQTWVSYMISNIQNIFGKGQTGVAALQGAVDGHSASNWETQAASVGLTDFEVSYAGTVSTLTAGAQLYAIASHCMNVKAANPSLFDRAPFTTALASWDSADVVSFVADIQSEA